MSKLSTRVDRLEAKERPNTQYFWADAESTQKERDEMVETKLKEGGLPPQTETVVFRWQT